MLTIGKCDKKKKVLRCQLTVNSYGQWGVIAVSGLVKTWVRKTCMTYLNVFDWILLTYSFKSL